MASTAVAQPQAIKFASKVSPQDRRDLEKFVKFLALKMVQVVVQSRLGEKVKTPSKAMASSTDWFSLAIQDIPEVTQETKKALSGHIPTVVTSPLCVEISLKTNEGDSLVLELWRLQAVNECCDTTPRITYTVYSRMGLLLKSIISITRVTPAYRLSRKQGADSFVLCYRVYMGDSDDSVLGEGSQSCLVGQIDTPIGAYKVALKYRTQLTLMPRDGSKDPEAMIVKSDHFTPDFSPHLCRANDIQAGSSSSEQVGTSDESQDACHTFVNTPPTPSSLRHNKSEQRFSFDEGPRFGAFAEPLGGSRKSLANEFVLPELPVPAFMKEKQHETRKSAVEPNAKREEAAVTTKTLTGSGEFDSRRSTSSPGPVSEDFVMVELKTPFAESDASHDIGAFFRECQAAPPSLSSFSNPVQAEAPNLDLGVQLQHFETQLKDYDDLVKSLRIDEEESEEK